MQDTYHLTMRQKDPLDRYPRYQATPERMAYHLDCARSDDFACDNIAGLLGLLYPNATWSN